MAFKVYGMFLVFFMMVSLLPTTVKVTCTVQTVIEDVTTTEVTFLASNGTSSFKATNLKKCRPEDCAAIYREGKTKSGVYQIWPEGWKNCGVRVFCDNEKDGGGWTVIQRRGDFGKPNDYFFRRWRDYKFGFGNISEDFWLGNEQIMHISAQDNYELRVDLKAMDGEVKYAVYSEFFIDNESTNYTLYIHGYSGDAGDSFGPHNGYAFTTQDQDHDKNDRLNCAQQYNGAWWYTTSHHSNLNGLYLNGSHDSFADGITWYHWKGYKYSYKEVVIKIRPKGFLEAA